jgi:hypothetical protein
VRGRMEGMGQSAEFGKFLKAMRSRLTPENAGIASGSGGRRVPGLRREEIARLADVSTDYYTRLEEGPQHPPVPGGAGFGGAGPAPGSG